MSATSPFTGLAAWDTGNTQRRRVPRPMPERKIREIFRSRTMVTGQGTSGSFSFWAVDCLWKRSTGRLDSDRPRLIALSPPRFQINFPKSAHVIIMMMTVPVTVPSPRSKPAEPTRQTRFPRHLLVWLCLCPLSLHTTFQELECVLRAPPNTQCASRSGTVAWQYTQLRLGTFNGGAFFEFAPGAYSASRASRSEAAIVSRTLR